MPISVHSDPGRGAASLKPGEKQCYICGRLITKQNSPHFWCLTKKEMDRAIERFNREADAQPVAKPVAPQSTMLETVMNKIHRIFSQIVLSLDI